MRKGQFINNILCKLGYHRFTYEVISKHANTSYGYFVNVDRRCELCFKQISHREEQR